jgi:hypothetical protein
MGSQVRLQSAPGREALGKAHCSRHGPVCKKPEGPPLAPLTTARPREIVAGRSLQRPIVLLSVGEPARPRIGWSDVTAPDHGRVQGRTDDRGAGGPGAALVLELLPADIRSVSSDDAGQPLLPWPARPFFRSMRNRRDRPLSWPGPSCGEALKRQTAADPLFEKRCDLASHGRLQRRSGMSCISPGGAADNSPGLRPWEDRETLVPQNETGVPRSQELAYSS